MTDSFLRPMSTEMGDRCADGALRVLAAGGLEALSLANVAREVPMTKSGLHQALGGRAGMVRMVVRVFAGRWEQWSTSGDARTGDLLRLPATESEIVAHRVWQTLIELASGEARAGRDLPSQRVAGVGSHEAASIRYRLQARWGRPPTALEITEVQALISGLRTALSVHIDTMSIEMARTILAGAVRSLGVARSRVPVLVAGGDRDRAAGRETVAERPVVQ